MRERVSETAAPRRGMRTGPVATNRGNHRPAFGAIVTLCATAWLAIGCRPSSPADSPAAHDAANAPASQDAYVGSVACARCHAEQTRQYHGHPMSQSLADMADATPIESYDRAEFTTLPGLVYYVERTETGVVHHEKQLDRAGEAIYDQGLPVAFAVGSGVRGRSYLLNRDGRLYASPISWYTGSSGWDLSPGYAPRNHPRFERRVSSGCVACHSGQATVDKQDVDRLDAHVPFVEPAIGCERCHGPGREHIAYREATAPRGRDPIVNPLALTGARRDAVCNQCHLQGRRRIVRTGRTEFDFRPGQMLTDVWVTFSKTAGVKTGNAAAVSQVEQMYASRCYQQSGGGLSCIGCHRGHGPPAAEQLDAVYRAQCLQCHGSDKSGCAEPLAKRKAVTATDSCIVCHMPKVPAADVHAAQTDHRILRRRPSEDAEHEPNAVLDGDNLVLFEEPGAVIPAAELHRARGIFLSERAEGGATHQAKPAVELLLPLMKVFSHDVDGWHALGKALQAAGQPELAAHAWGEVLALQPRHESTLELLAVQCHEARDFANARRYYEQLLDVNPSRSQYWGRYAHVLGQLGDVSKGIVAAERCLELNPSLVQTHVWLVEACRRTGDVERGKRHQALVERFQSMATPQPGQPRN